MARKIIILEKTPSQTGFMGFRFAMWADVPATRQTFYANASATSAVKGATGPEIAAIQGGSVTERVRDAQYPTQGVSLADIQADLVNIFNAFQTEITAFNPWQRYGTTYDGSTWTPVNIG